MSDFIDKLNEMCRAEATAAIGDPDASAMMTAALVTELANAIAVLAQGDPAASRAAARQSATILPHMVFDKAALVRHCATKMKAEAAVRLQQGAGKP